MARTRRRCAVRSEFLETRLYLSRAGLIGADRGPKVDAGDSGRQDQAVEIVDQDTDAVDQGRDTATADTDQAAEEVVVVDPVVDQPTGEEPALDSDRLRDAEVILQRPQQTEPTGPTRDSDPAGDADVGPREQNVQDGTDESAEEVVVVVNERRPAEPTVVQETTTPDTRDGRNPARAVLDEELSVDAPNTGTADDSTNATDTPVTDVRPNDRQEPHVSVVDITDSVPTDRTDPTIAPPLPPGTTVAPTVIADPAEIDDWTEPTTNPREETPVVTVRETDHMDTRDETADPEVLPPDTTDEASNATPTDTLNDDDASENSDSEPAVETDEPAAATEGEADDDSQESTPLPIAQPEVGEHNTVLADSPRAQWRPELTAYGPTWHPATDRPSLDLTLRMSQQTFSISSPQFIAEAEDANVAVSDAAMLGILLLVLNRARRRSVSDNVIASSAPFEPYGDGVSTTRRRRHRFGGNSRLPLPRNAFRTLTDAVASTIHGEQTAHREAIPYDAVFADGATMALLYRKDFEAPRELQGSGSLATFVGSILAGSGYALQRLVQRVRMSRGFRRRRRTPLRRPAKPRYSGPTI
ncbi:MAG: hypothetical protein R3C19_03150 [Planctomycetaceae bacterium]